VYDEVLYQVDADMATLVDRVGLSDVELQERAHLQEWILAHPVILGPGVEIAGEWSFRDSKQSTISSVSTPDGSMPAARRGLVAAPYEGSRA
jgi:hypothetical protein